MNSDEIYLYLSSKDCIELYPQNKTSDFSVSLAKTLDLDETWSVALCEIIFDCISPEVGELNIYSNLIRHVIVGCGENQLLARIDAIRENKVNRQIETPIYLPVSLEDLREIKVSLRDDKGNSPIDGRVILVLHFKKNLPLMDNCTIILKSNDCMDIFPSNNTSHFKVRLPYELSYAPNEYEVGLLNIAFTHSSNLIEEGEGLISFSENEKDVPLKVNPELIKFKYDKTKGLEDFVIQLNSASQKFAKENNTIRQGPEYSIDDRKLTVSKMGHYFSDIDGKIKKFDFRFDLETKKYISSGLAKSKVVDSIYVHCSIAEPTIVGSTLAPVLRVINVAQIKSGERMYIVFEQPYYSTLREHLIRDIEINLEDYHSNVPLFSRTDQVVLTLHIRRKTLLDN